MYIELDDKEFEGKYRSTLESIVNFKRPFVPIQKKDWEIAFLPHGMNVDRRSYEALAEGAKMCGDYYAVALPVETPINEVKKFMVNWSIESWEKLRCGTILGHMDTFVFADSGRWGAFFGVDEYSYVAADVEFMDCFFMKLGGRDVVKARFLEFVDDEWCVDKKFKESVRTLASKL